MLLTIKPSNIVPIIEDRPLYSNFNKPHEAFDNRTLSEMPEVADSYDRG